MYSFLKQLSKQVENLNASKVANSILLPLNLIQKQQKSKLNRKLISKNTGFNKKLLNPFKEKIIKNYKINSIYKLKLTNRKD
jgi:DUF917 family protein